jgi:glucosamine--fructose-6-phosphate aminotransferase (isomerizing)
VVATTDEHSLVLSGIRTIRADDVCGLIGYVGDREAQDVVLGGLERLEYRGYDSAGICVVENGVLRSSRAVGSLSFLTAELSGQASDATTAIGHTRWATHGRVSVENAHPLTGCEEDEVAVVLNGIVENFWQLRLRLSASGHVFRSETDAEVVAHLVEEHYEGDLAAAVRGACRELDGHFAFVVLHHGHPDLLVGTRRHCPLVLGRDDNESILASMIAAFITETRHVQFLEDDDVVEVWAGGARFTRPDGTVVGRAVEVVEWDDETAERDGHESFMLKEIHEQPDAVRRTLAGRVLEGSPALGDSGLDEQTVRSVNRIVLVACGTAYHAGLIGKYAIEAWARVSCEPHIASEWRYIDPILDESTLVIGISQSGETADTLAALRLAQERGTRTIAITNTPGSQITREADSVLLTRAGLEMGVAATKTFTAQAALLYILALDFAAKRGALPHEEIRALTAEVERLPQKLEQFLAGDHPLDLIAEAHADERFFLYLGRHLGLPACLEGALKLKEVAYIPTEAYSAGEMKHGPIALLGEQTPVVVIATDSHVYEKVVSNIQEVRARGAQVIAIASDGNEAIQHLADQVIFVPRAHPFIEPVLAVVPLQLLAHRIAELHHLDVDRPRNLAKTVTVE